MALMTKDQVIDIVKYELTADIVNLELSDEIIESNVDRATMISSDYFNYVSYKTLPITSTGTSSGYIDLSELDPDGIPVITGVYPTQNVANFDATLLGLGSFYIQGHRNWDEKIHTYSTMINKLTTLESILGRGSRVVGDKLYLDKYAPDVTIEFIPNTVKIENINEGSWLQWIIEFAVALSKRQMAQARGKFVVGSNPHQINAATLLEESNAAIATLMDQLENKGVLQASR